jgi:hypothetical protein
MKWWQVLSSIQLRIILVIEVWPAIQKNILIKKPGPNSHRSISSDDLKFYTILYQPVFWIVLLNPDQDLCFFAESISRPKRVVDLKKLNNVF